MSGIEAKYRLAASRCFYYTRFVHGFVRTHCLELENEKAPLQDGDFGYRGGKQEDFTCTQQSERVTLAMLGILENSTCHLLVTSDQQQVAQRPFVFQIFSTSEPNFKTSSPSATYFPPP